MGLYMLLAQPDEWTRLYNCSFYSVDSIPLEKRRHVVFAAVVMALFIIYEVLYAPCLYAMCRKNLRSIFCYKIMIEMAIFDMLSLPLTALVPAIYTYYGLMYCSAPKLTYVMGSFTLALWIGYSTTTLILATNRCLALNSKYSRIFDGKWVQIGWLSVSPIAAVLTVFFGNAAAFNSQLCAWFFNPHMMYVTDDDGSKYASHLHEINNLVFGSFLPTIYAVFFWRHRGIMRTGKRGTAKTEIQLFIQAFIINVSIALMALMYMSMQILPVPTYCIALAHIAWVVVGGTPPIVYLTMNRAIRRTLRGTPTTQIGITNPLSHPSLSAGKVDSNSVGAVMATVSQLENDKH